MPFPSVLNGSWWEIHIHSNCSSLINTESLFFFCLLSIFFFVFSFYQFDFYVSGHGFLFLNFILLIFLYSRFLLVIYFIHISVYMSIPISQFIPPHPRPHFRPLVSIRLLSTSASLFLPCKLVHLYHFSRFHIYGHGFLRGLFCLGSLNFSNLYIHCVFYQVWKVFSHYFLKCFSALHSFTFLLGCQWLQCWTFWYPSGPWGFIHFFFLLVFQTW